MLEKIEFYINGERRCLFSDPTERLVDFIRNTLHLTGTKEGCGDGDCGACTVLLGKPEGGHIKYESVASCLIPVGKINGCSLITIEGLGKDNGSVNIIQRFILDKHGVQCGFCTPGIVMSFSGVLANNKKPSLEDLLIALDGNICRCTGYEGLKKAAIAIKDFLICNEDYDILPESVRKIECDLLEMYREEIINESYSIPTSLVNVFHLMDTQRAFIVAGNSDIGVKTHLHGRDESLSYIDISRVKDMKGIGISNEEISIGASTTISEILQCDYLVSKFPVIKDVFERMASTQIRNMATIVGNICNASPIADGALLMTSFDAIVDIATPSGVERHIPIRSFYLGYKKLAMKPDELVVRIRIPDNDDKYSFIKSSKRRSVDIATVNSIARLKEGKMHISFGGVSSVITSIEIPLEGDITKIKTLADSVADEFSPISDVRGSIEFRKALISGHLIKHTLRFLGRDI